MPDGRIRACHDGSDRDALGLTTELVAIGLLSQPADHELLRLDSMFLAGLVESDAAFTSRWVAAKVLALVGDPRISTTEPEMLDVEGGPAHVGLDLEEVPAVVAQWSHVGVERAWIEKEVPRHTVSLGSFRISKYLVTNKDYLAFLQDASDGFVPLNWKNGIYDMTSSNHPVEGIPTAAAEDYCAWMGRVTGRSFRLPSEDEWHLAYVGSSQSDFPWGREFDPSRCNTAESRILTTTPVGLFPTGRAACGALDMAGNVEEFVANDYAPYVGADAVSDHLSQNGPYRVAKGGSWGRFGDLARASRRHGWYRGDLYSVGFRIAEQLPRDAETAREPTT